MSREFETTEPHVQITIRIPASTYNYIKKLSIASLRSVAHVIRDLLIDKAVNAAPAPALQCDLTLHHTKVVDQVRGIRGNLTMAVDDLLLLGADFLHLAAPLNKLKTLAYEIAVSSKQGRASDEQADRQLMILRGPAADLNMWMRQRNTICSQPDLRQYQAVLLQVTNAISDAIKVAS